MTLLWNGVWDHAALVEDLASAGSGGLNAAYFTRHAHRATGARRLAAGVLALLCGGAALDAAVHLATAGPAVELLARAPLLVANLAVTALVLAGARASIPRGAPGTDR